MEDQQNTISSQAMLSAAAGMMFFAPFVKHGLNPDSPFSDEEKNFIMWYVQVWYVNLIFLAIVLITELFNITYIYPVLSWIITIWCFAIYIITVFCVFSCANRLSMRKSDEKIVQDVQNKKGILKAYTPILNFILWFRQENYNMPYWWLKESILLWSCFIFWTLLMWSSFGTWMLIIIIVRVVLLMLNIDITPLSSKKAINWTFLCNPWEIAAYIFAPIVSKLKKADYETILQARKQAYAQWQAFWIWIIIQYPLFIGILYLIYRNVTISRVQITLVVAAILWILRIIIFYKYKGTFLKIPILSEIVSLVVH